MPNSYPVDWAGPADLNWGSQVGGLLRQALEARRQNQLLEQERQRRAEQEQYERGQAAIQNERQRLADDWQLENAKLTREKLGLEIKDKKFEMSTKAHQERLASAEEQGRQFIAQNPQGAADISRYAAIPETSDEFASAPPDAAQFAPSAVQVPAIPGYEQGEPDIAPARSVSPIQVAMNRAKANAEAQRLKSVGIASDETARRGAAEPFVIADDERTAKLQAARDAATEARITRAAEKAASLQGQKRTDSLRKEYNKESKKPYEALADLDRYTAPVLQGRAAGRAATSADQFALIYAFNKSLDPTSVVRESEFKNTKGVGAGIDQRAYLMLQNWRSGAQLTEAQVSEMLDTIGRARSATVTSLNSISERYRDLSLGMDVDPSQVIRESQAAPADQGGGEQGQGGGSADAIRKRLGLR